MKKLKAVLGITLVGMLVFTGCTQVTKTEEGKNKEVVAKVYNEKVTKGQFNERFAAVQKNIDFEYAKQAAEDTKLKAEGKNINEQAPNRLPADKNAFIKAQKEQVLNALVEENMLEYQAKKLKCEVPAEELNKTVQEKIDEGIKENGGSKEKFAEAIKNNTGLTYDEYIPFITSVMKSQLTYQNVVKAVTKDVAVTDEEAKKDYDAAPYKYMEKPGKVYFSHILVATKEEADKVRKEIVDGGNFAELAKKYSTDPGSKDNGGKYPDGMEYEQLDPAFAAAAYKLKDGELSEPVKGMHGYYIIKVEKKEDYPIKPFDTVKDQIKQQLLMQKKEEVLKTTFTKWQKEAKIKTYPENL